MMYRPLVFLTLLFLMHSCSGQQHSPSEQVRTRTISDSDKEYWYQGKAEISSYELKQARYGEIRNGKAAMIFVTEHYDPSSETKPNVTDEGDVPVMKLNFTRKFKTGVYPYSIMTSTFFPFEEGNHSLKISSSSQEWCGHTYMEMVNHEKFNMTIHSYFEGETTTIEQSEQLLEDDIWSMIRLRPDDLPQGETQMIPSFSFLRLKHEEAEPRKCDLRLESVNDTVYAYIVNYPTLNRSLAIRFQKQFPHQILSWSERYSSGGKQLTTTGERIETVMLDYWNRNATKDSILRKELGLEP